MNALEASFIAFMKERHSIYRKREAGEPWPWTDDKILQAYKFTNVYRLLDHETQNLLKSMKRVKGGKDSWQLMWHIVAYRMFNWLPTYEALRKDKAILPWNKAQALMTLNRLRLRGDKIFTGAYLVTGVASIPGRKKNISVPKHHLAVDSLSIIYKDVKTAYADIKKNNSLEYAVSRMIEWPMVGRFVAYEFACDFTYFNIMKKPKDKFTWANPGPGAMRGLNRIYRGGPKNKLKGQNTRGGYNREMKSLLAMAASALEVGEDMPTLQMRDIEHCLCEFDKYLRVKYDEGSPRSLFIPPHLRKQS